MNIYKIVVCSYVISMVFSYENANQHNYKELSTRAEYDELIADQKPVVIKLYATWCGPCKAYEADFNAFAGKHQDTINAAAIDIDNREFSGLLKQEQVASVPTTWFIQDGRIVEKKKGQQRPKDLENLVQQLFKRVEKEQSQPKIEKRQKPQPKPVMIEEEEQEESVQSSAVQELSSVKEYDEIVASGKPVVVKFYAEWCGACAALRPIFEELALQYGAKVVFVAIDAENPAFKRLADKYVDSYPTLLFITKGQVKDSNVGILSKTALERYVNSLLSQEKMIKMRMEEPAGEEEEEVVVVEQPKKKQYKKPARQANRRTKYRRYQEEDFE